MVHGLTLKMQPSTRPNRNECSSSGLFDFVGSVLLEAHLYCGGKKHQNKDDDDETYTQGFLSGWAVFHLKNSAFPYAFLLKLSF